MTKTLLARSVLLVAAFTALLPAQDHPAHKPAPVISIEFQGGSLRELIDAMRRIDPKLNITASAMAKDVKLPDLSLKGATVMNVLAAAASITPAEYAVGCREAGAGGEPVYVVSVLRTPRAGVAMPREERETSVFSLRPLVEPQPGDSKDKAIHLSVESMLSALEAGVQLTGGEQAELKYHRDSGLLFIKGTSAQLDVARQVLQSVQRDQTEVRHALDHQRQDATQRARAEKQAEGKADKK